MTNTTLKKETIAQILRLYNETPLGKRAIAKKLGISTNSVRKYLKENNIRG